MFEATEVEQRLVDAVAAGELLDVSDDADRDVRAGLVRDLLRGLRVETPDPRGVRLRGARIVGVLDLTDVRASIPLVLTSCEHEDRIVLERAHLPYLDLRDSTFPELLGDDFVCEHDVCLDGIRSRQLVLTDVKITGLLSLSEAKLSAGDQPALAADRITVYGGMFLNDGFEAGSDSEDGTIRLLGGNITGVLNLRSARLRATSGSALSADGLTVGDGAFLDEGFEAGSDGGDAAIRLIDANITSQLDLSDAKVTAVGEPALLAAGLVVGQLLLNYGFRARSECVGGTIQLAGANVTGNFSLRNAEISNTSPAGLVLAVSSAKVGGDLTLPLRAFAGESFQVNLDGFSYAFVPQGLTCDEWLSLLAEHTTAYAAQPYQQLAAVYRGAGHDRDVRRILIAQQRDHRRRGDIGGRGRKLLHLAGGLFIGYGHRPWRALGFLVVVCALAGVVAVSASMLGLAVRPGPQGGPCSVVEAIGMAMDTSIPLLKLGGEKRCGIVAATTWGQVFYLSTYLLQALGWAFATLFVAGYTGLVRKTT